MYLFKTISTYFASNILPSAIPVKYGCHCKQRLGRVLDPRYQSDNATKVVFMASGERKVSSLI